jgi:hypothetical protein
MKNFVAVLPLLVICSLLASNTDAKPPFAKREKKACNYCHTSDAGGARGFRGIYYNSHSLTFRNFKEAAEAKKAGVKVGATGEKSKPTKPYTGK